MKIDNGNTRIYIPQDISFFLFSQMSGWAKGWEWVMEYSILVIMTTASASACCSEIERNFSLKTWSNKKFREGKCHRYLILWKGLIIFFIDRFPLISSCSQTALSAHRAKEHSLSSVCLSLPFIIMEMETIIQLSIHFKILAALKIPRVWDLKSIQGRTFRF